MVSTAIDLDLDGRMAYPVFLLQQALNISNDCRLARNRLADSYVHGQHQLLRCQAPDVNMVNAVDAGHMVNNALLHRGDVQPLRCAFQ